MINRFHNAAPSVAAPNANLQANKPKAGDGFGLLLNKLADPVAEQQTPQHYSGLLEEPTAEPVSDNASMPFNRFIDVAEMSIDVSTNHFLTSPMGIRTQQNLFATIQPEIHLPQTESALFATPEAAIITNIAELSVTNQTIPTAQDTSDPHTSVSKHSTKQGGDVELVAMPWRLQANAGMSYQSTAQQLKNIGETRSGLTTIIQATSAHAVDKNPLPSLSSNGSQFEGVKIDKVLQFYRISEAASALANAFESARSSRADTRASLIMWPQRVLHWLADGDATTAWVRDYQLDASGTRTLVDALRCFAEQQDFSLRRIMLNGHEVWRSPSTF